MSATVFDNGDEPYLAWMAAHRSGFVLNTERTSGSSLAVLHRAGCYHIRTYGKGQLPGGFTERDYIKVCSLLVGDLQAWTASARPSAMPSRCRSCCPEAFSFVVGRDYTKQDIYRIVEVPTEQQGGDWNTGYHARGHAYFIFANIGNKGRTGHDYDNHFVGDRLVWYGKLGSKLQHQSIQQLLSPDYTAYVFFRDNDRAPYTFAGIGTPEQVRDTSPVRVSWAFNTPGETHPERSPTEAPSSTQYSEGAVSRVLVNAYERNPAARKACICHYSAVCQICGFDFGREYGPLAEGFIHVHHLRPLAESSES